MGKLVDKHEHLLGGKATFSPFSVCKALIVLAEGAIISTTVGIQGMAIVVDSRFRGNDLGCLMHGDR